MAATRAAGGYDKYGWIVLSVSAVLGLLAAMVLILPPTFILVEPAFRAGNVPGALWASGATWVFFNVVVLIILWNNFREGERWAWWVLWLLPLLWLSHFIFNPATVHNLIYRHCYGAGTPPCVPWVLFRLSQPTLPRQLSESVRVDG